MPRLIKRYGSRKLYDTSSSQYASLEDLAAWIRAGEEVRVVDNRTGDDVTAQVLGQVITDEGRKGRAVAPSDLLHDLIRTGGDALRSGAEQLRQGVEQAVQKGVDRIGPVRRMREETAELRSRLADLEAALERMEDGDSSTRARRGKKKK